MIVKYRFEIYFLTLTEFSYMCPHLIIHFISIDSDSTICYYGLNSKINKVYSLLLRSSKSSGSDIIIFHIYTTKNFISHDIMLDSHTKCLLTSCCNFCITDLLASSVLFGEPLIIIKSVFHCCCWPGAHYMDLVMWEAAELQINSWRTYLIDESIYGDLACWENTSI